MKKRLLVIVLMFSLILPFVVKAEDNGEKYESTNLKETLENEKVKYNLDDYKETNKQATIYLFRGNGCSFCNSFLTFLGSITEEYGKYFKLEAYETWNNDDNAELLQKVVEFTGEDASGVPFIIIGGKVFPGYISEWDQNIIDAIMDEYEAKEKYDLFAEMEKAEKEAEKEAAKANLASIMPIVLWNLGIITFATIIIITVVCVNTKKINKKIEAITKKTDTKENELTSEEKNIEKETTINKKAKKTEKKVSKEKQKK